MRVAQLGRWIQSTTNRTALLTTRLADLVAAYSAVGLDLNVTSMCLFSGPADRTRFSWAEYSWDHGGLTGKIYLNSASWLSTGDAALGDTARARSFIRHYRHLLPSVDTLTLPHHGAAGNFHEELLPAANPRFCVVAADFMFDSWQHPGAKVVQSVASHGSHLFMVTSKPVTDLHERIVFR
jgi:hypothetical protein